MNLVPSPAAPTSPRRPHGFFRPPERRAIPGRRIRAAAAASACIILSACFGGTPHFAEPMAPIHELGHDWRKHFSYGLDLLDQDTPLNNRAVFTRAAFASAARFARDHAPSYAGLGLAESMLGNQGEAEVAFLNAALIEDRSLYWALATIAALRNGDEAVARTLFDAMQSAKIQSDDPASRFVREVYLAENPPSEAAITRIPYQARIEGLDDDLICNDTSDDDVCRDLNIVANLYFVRRTSSETMARGTDFFNELTVQLGAERTQSWEKNSGQDWQMSILNEVTLSIPEIQYAVRITPQASNSKVYVDAAPSVVTSIGNTSEIHEGANLTILYNSTGDAEEYTAETGLTLHIEPDRATPRYASLQLQFEFSSIATFEPSALAQVLNVSKNTYQITGYFPYGRPVVLGTIANTTKQHTNSGQTVLDRIPLVGGAFGQSDTQLATSDTLILARLSVPSAFHGSHEQRVLDAMRGMGVEVMGYDMIERRRIVHLAPDLLDFLPAFLKTGALSGTGFEG
ncbi:hypothetical protein P7L70_26105 [Tistrella mobilis]|uniref:hypothetical protein n=1 Tax=Tistrella mobilis TaxID=171437 RepID=UPI003557D304